MKDYYVLIQDHGIGTKDGDFFIEQGGLEQDWGKNWELIQAKDLDDARQVAIRMRRERYPNCHKTIGEEGCRNPMFNALDKMGITDDMEFTKEERRKILDKILGD